MTTVFVLGNGISRREINLKQLQTIGAIYGCNALYRDFTPNVLVATDRPIAEEIQNSGYAKQNKFYTRRPISGLGALELPEKYRGFSSGPNALGLAALDHKSDIYLIGFDMGPVEGKFNNIYADTEFYKTSEHPPTFTGNWVKQICQIIKDFPELRFYRVYGATTARIPELENLPNLQHVELATFLDRINNKKDL